MIVVAVVGCSMMVFQAKAQLFTFYFLNFVACDRGNPLLGARQLG